jgi:hypothetical protein
MLSGSQRGAGSFVPQAHYHVNANDLVALTSGGDLVGEGAPVKT